MRGKLSRMWRSGLSLMLVFCMLVGMAPAAFATDSSEPTTIKYVSLGDSVSLGSGSYPYQFESWLEAEGYADDVDHSALAMEAMRAEDLHFILTYSGANSAVAEGEWNEAAWNKAFPDAGDYYTWKNFTSNGVITAEVAKQYQAAVKEADLLTVGIGNANFGDFLMDCVIDGDLDKADVDEAMKSLEESWKNQLVTYYDQLMAKLEAEVGSEMAVSLANAMVYTMVGYALNYQCVLNRIVELNPDVEVIIVPVINTMNGIKITYNGNTYNLGGYLAEGLKILNAYMVAVPAAMQALGLYPNAKFYYADVDDIGTVELQGNVAGSLSREDIMATVVGTEDNPGMIWELLADQVNEIYADAELVDGDEEFKAFVDQYATWGPEARAEYVAKLDENNELVKDNVNKAISAALYLAFEEAIIESKNAPLSVEGLKGITDLKTAMDEVMLTFEEKLEEAGDTYEEVAYDAAYGLIVKEFNAKVDEKVAAQDIENFKSDLNSDEVGILLTGGDGAQAIIKEMAYEIAVAGVYTEVGVELSVDELKSVIAGDDEDLLNDVLYSGAANKVPESTNPNVQKYGKYLDKETIKGLNEGITAVKYDLAAKVMNEQLHADYQITGEQFANLAGHSGEVDNDVLKNTITSYVAKDRGISFEEAVDLMEEMSTMTPYDMCQKVADNSEGKFTQYDVIALWQGTNPDGETDDQVAYKIIANETDDKTAADIEAIATKSDEVLFEEVADELGVSVDVVKAAYKDKTDADIVAKVDEALEARAEVRKAISDLKIEVQDKIDEILEIQAKVNDASITLQNKIAEAETQLDDAIDSLRKTINEIKTDVIGDIGNVIEEAVKNMESTVAEVAPDVQKKLDENLDYLCDLLGVSDALGAVVEKNATLSGLLNIMARCVIGDGLGMLPTANGHNTIAVAVETSYKTKHTVQDETEKNVKLAIEKVMEVLEENGMMIVDKATIMKGLEYISDLDTAVEDLKTVLQDQIDKYKKDVLGTLQDDLAAMQKLLSELESELAELQDVLTTLQNKLNNIKNKPDSAASTIEALEKAIDETNAAIAATKEKIAFINKCIADLNEKLGQINTTLGELQTAIDNMEAAVKALYNAVNTKDISFHDAFNNLEELRAAAIEAVYAVEDLYHELKDLGKDTIKFIDTVKDEAETAVKLLGGALYAAYNLLPANIQAKIEAEADAKIETLKAQITDLKAQLEQEVKEEVKAELQKQIDALEAEIEEVKAKAADDIEKLGGVNEDVVKLIEDVLGETYDAIYAEYKNVTGALKIEVDTKNEVIEAGAQAIKNLIKFAEEQVEKVVEEAKAIYVDVTNADYTITDSSYYVALGDASAYSASDSYVDILAADPQLALSTEEYMNAYDTRTIDEMLADIQGGEIPEKLDEADLITIRFDNSQIVKNAFIHAFTYMKGADVVYTFEWEKLIGAKGVEAVNAFLTALEEKLEACGMEDMKLVEMVDGATLPAEGRTLDKAFVHMAEAYLYYSIQYMFSIPEYVAEINKLNPEAVIVFVGMSNPFGNTVLTHENLNIEIGNYVGTIVDYVDMISKVFCMMFPNATYVSAKDVETSASNVEMDLTQFFVNYVQNQNSTLYPTETGHQYIKDQILKALTITDERGTEPEGLLGDVNDDGVVDGRDIIRLARFLGEVEGTVIHEKNSDVTVDGIVDGRDLIRLVRFLGEVPGVELG